MIRKLFFIFCLLVLSACGAEPVSLPIPFTGALTAETDAFVENGLSIDQDENWELFTEVDGASVGLIHRDVRFCSQPVNDGTKVSCTMPVTLSLDDGSTVSSNAQFFCFPFNLEPSTACADASCDLSEVGSQIITLSCIGSGVIESGTGIYADLVREGTINYVGLEQRVLQADGATHTFCRTVRSDWQVR